MPRKKPVQPALFDVKTTTAPCVPALRDAVSRWAPTTTLARPRRRANSSTTGSTPTTAWADGRKFAYHYSQQHAIETLIYLFEIAHIRRQKALLETFSGRSDLKLLQFDDFARYCVKMATGSGKTKVMALAIAWQYFNAVAEARDDYARTFLVIAPNVIVFERLKTDFGGGRIFINDPVIPPELQIYPRIPCYLRGEGERAGSEGALYLTNIQQMHERRRHGRRRAGRDDGHAGSEAAGDDAGQSRTSCRASPPAAAPSWC